MTDEIIKFFRKYALVWVIALVSFISGLGVMSFYGHQSIAIVILVFVMFVALVALVRLINATDKEKK
jgi:hypothetical protein